MTTRRTVRRWRGGERITAARLNESVDGINDALGRIKPPRVTEPSDANAQVTEDEQDGLESATVWRWVASVTRTERIEDADDSEVYIDVDITRAIYVRKPDGELIKIETENPANG